MKILSKYFDSIFIVNYSPHVIYSGIEVWDIFNESHKKYGATIVKNKGYDALQAYPVNLSELYTYHEICIFSGIVEKMIVKESSIWSITKPVQQKIPMVR